MLRQLRTPTAIVLDCGFDHKDDSSIIAGVSSVQYCKFQRGAGDAQCLLGH
jgi:hypothetical protein